MRVFVTGGTGFIGKYFVRLAHQHGHDLVLLVRPNSDLRDLPDGLSYIRESLFDVDALTRAMQGCDCLVHLANVYTFWERDPSIYSLVNVEGTRCVYQAALQAGVKKVLHVGTAVVWGNAVDCPYSENSAWGTKTYSRYAQSKREADLLAWSLYQQGLPVVGVYPASVIGPGDTKSSGQMLRDIVYRRLPATGLQDAQITFVGVEDVAGAMVAILEKDGLIGEKFIIGKETISLGEYMQIVSRTAGVRLPWIKLPLWGVWGVSVLVSAFARLTGKPPFWGMSLDQTRTFSNGFACNGQKAERLLGISYHPVRETLQETTRWVLTESRNKKSG